jgi:hypothetical protein
MCARFGAGLDLLELGSSPGDLLDDVLNRCRLDEGLGIFVPRWCTRLRHSCTVARLTSSSSAIETLSSPANAPHNNLAQRHLLRGAVSALPLPKLHLLSRRRLDRQTHVGHGMRHSKSHKLCLVIYRTLH